MSYSNFILQLLWSHFFCPLHIDFTFELHIDFPQLNVFIVFFSVFFDSFNSLCNWWEQSKKYSSSPFRLMRINTPYHTLFSHSYHFMSLYSSLILFLQSYPFFFFAFIVARELMLQHQYWGSSGLGTLGMSGS